MTADDLTFELCEFCEKKSDPRLHVCKTMPIDWERLKRLCHEPDIQKEAATRDTRAVTAIKRCVDEKYPEIEFLPPLETYEDLCFWSRWDLLRIRGVGSRTVRPIEEILKYNGLSLFECTFQKAVGRRRTLGRQQREAKLQDEQRKKYGIPSIPDILS